MGRNIPFRENGFDRAFVAARIAVDAFSELGCLPGPSADIYGLGALLWSLATGSIPHGHTHRLGEVEIPPSLSAIYDKCLAVDPRQRFQTVADLIAQLDTLGIEAIPSDS